jgi:ribosome biogenesis GTPase / thiamine phosphate phosphatase
MTASVALDEGLVVATHGRSVIVQTAAGARITCHTRGKRTDVVVGDQVRWAISGDQGVVEAIVPRRNLLHRQDEWRTKAFAANLDHVLIIVAVEPPFSDMQLTRSLIAVQDAGLSATIVCNKIDVPNAQATLTRLQAYASVDVDVLALAVKAQPDDARLRLAPLLRGHTTLVIGASGVGKSSLVNLMVPDADAQIGDISRALNAGKHTTTATRWYQVSDATLITAPESAASEAAAGASTSALIDTPGFQQFGLHHISSERLVGLMPDIQRHATTCKFYNCTHRHEPGCGVLAAVDRGEISPVRLRVYEELLAEAEDGKR